MGVEMCKGKAKAARREPNGKYFGQNEPFFPLPFFAEMAGKDAYLVIFFRKYTNSVSYTHLDVYKRQSPPFPLDRLTRQMSLEKTAVPTESLSLIQI